MDKNAKMIASLQKENLSLKKKSAKSDAALIDMVNEVYSCTPARPPARPPARL